jgi:hypothetical protein
MNPELISTVRKIANKREVPAEQVLAVIEMFSGGEQYMSPWDSKLNADLDKAAPLFDTTPLQMLETLHKFGKIPTLQYDPNYTRWASSVKFSSIKGKYNFLFSFRMGLGWLPVKDILMPDIMFMPNKILPYLKKYAHSVETQIGKVCDLVASAQVKSSIESMNNIIAIRKMISGSVVSILPETYELVNTSRRMKRSIILDLEGDDPGVE